MPPGAYALVGFFALVSVVSGAVATAIIGPRRWWSAVAPALSAFGSLYLVGHRLAIGVGPEVSLFGFRISLPFDIAVGLVTSLATAGVQRRLLGLLEAQQRGTGRDRLT